MEEENCYEGQMDKLFTGGGLWQHRTLRTLFDPLSSEWHRTNMYRKIEIIETIIQSGINLNHLIRQYKLRYNEQGRHDIAIEVDSALAYLLEYKIKNAN